MGISFRRRPFDYNDFGKPLLPSTLQDVGLQFNVSHSGEHALIAVARDVLIGVDIEQIKNDIDFDSLVRVVLSPRQLNEFTELRAADKSVMFFRCWTCKESVVKAIGRGLSIALDSFDITLQPELPPRITWFDSHPQTEQDWALHSMGIASGYAATLAVNSRSCISRVLKFSPPDLAETLRLCPDRL